MSQQRSMRLEVSDAKFDKAPLLPPEIQSISESQSPITCFLGLEICSDCPNSSFS